MKDEARRTLAEAKKRLVDTRAAVAQAAREQQLTDARHERGASLFRAATRDVAPLPAPNRPVRQPVRVAPVPRQRQLDERAALKASIVDAIDGDALIESDQDLSYARDGISPQTVRKLRRGQWVVQAQLDLHGMTRDEAREAVLEFIQVAVREGKRCVRVVHGKGLGSANREPVLKSRVWHWLAHSGAVLAFTQARAAEGGAGALVVLLTPHPA